MNSFTVLLLCIQACLVQNVLGQCFGALNPAAITPTALGATAPFGYRGTAGELAYPAAAWAGGYPAGLAPYGGAGEGNVEVAGELPVAGTTGVVGQVPIMGAVNFVGAIPAIGTVSITGNCACGAGVSYLY